LCILIPVWPCAFSSPKVVSGQALLKHNVA